MIEIHDGNYYSETMKQQIVVGVSEMFKKAKTILPSIATMAKLTKTSRAATVFIVSVS